MKFIIDKKIMNEFFINAFLFVSILFPNDIYNIKKILFFVIIIVNLRLIVSSLTNKKNRLIAFYGFIFPSLLVLYSSILTGNFLTAFFRSFTAYLFLIIFVVKYYEIDFEFLLMKNLRLIIILTLLIALFDLIGIIDVNSNKFLYKFFYEYNIGLIGKSSLYPFYYKIFFKTSPLFVFVLFKKFDNSEYIYTLMLIAALILTGTRANVLFPLFFILLFYFSSTKNNKSKIIKFILVLIAITCTIKYFNLINESLFETFIAKGKDSDLVRKGHIKGIKELITNDPWVILRGSGMGSEFYSYGVGNYTSSIEWSYIDLWRQMGFLFFFLFLIFIVIPIFYKIQVEKYKKYAYISYLFIAATNPLLFSSTAYIAYIYMYYSFNKKSL